MQYSTIPADHHSPRRHSTDEEFSTPARQLPATDSFECARPSNHIMRDLEWSVGAGLLGGAMVVAGTVAVAPAVAGSAVALTGYGLAGLATGFVYHSRQYIARGDQADRKRCEEFATRLERDIASANLNHLKRLERELDGKVPYFWQVGMRLRASCLLEQILRAELRAERACLGATPVAQVDKMSPIWRPVVDASKARQKCWYFNRDRYMKSFHVAIQSARVRIADGTLNELDLVIGSISSSRAEVTEVHEIALAYSECLIIALKTAIERVHVQRRPVRSGAHILGVIS